MVPTLTHSIYARLVGSLQDQLATAGVSLLHGEVGYDLKRETAQIRVLLEKGVEGIVAVGTHHLPETMKLLRGREVPFVITYAVCENMDFPFVGFDNVKAGGMAARYLVTLGHRRLAMIAGVTWRNDRAADRVRGFCETAAALGISRESIEIVEAPYRMATGEAALRIILDKRPDVTAVFCGSDILAVGALKECRRRGLEIPAQLSIVGFDNLEIAEYVTPSLTTIAIPAEEMGARSAEFLLSKPAQRPLHAHVVLETKLIVRETSGPPRAAL
jgi:LacI family transcriptional regulator